MEHTPARAAERRVASAMMRGAVARCPNCGSGKLFRQYLKVANSCANCGEELHHHRADDAPPYFTIFIVGHILIPLVLWVEKSWKPEISTHMLIWLPLAVVLTLTLLPVVKGAVVGLQWALQMHGFELSAKAPRRQGADGAAGPLDDAHEGWTA